MLKRFVLPILTLVMTVFAPMAVAQTYQVTIDGNRSLASMIADLKFDEVSANVDEKHFPFTRGGTQITSTISVLTVTAVAPQEYASYDMAMKAVAVNDARPATLQEMLALAKSHPEVLDNDRTPIVALGTKWDIKNTTHSSVASMRSIKGVRTLDAVGAGVLGLHRSIRIVVVHK